MEVIAPPLEQIWCIFALKYGIWWQQFDHFSENQLTKYGAV